MSVYTSTAPHPYGVLPSGNALLKKDPYAVRRNGLGILGKITDEAILELLSYLNGNELVKILQLSRPLYIYTNYSDLWRDLTLRRFCDGFVFVNTWKDTFVKAMLIETDTKLGRVQRTFTPHLPIKVSNMYSNILHRSWICHTCDFQYACPGFFNDCGVPRRDAKDMTTEQFVTEFEMKNKAVIIKNAATEWPSLHRWTPEYLISQCKEKKFRATSATAPLAANFSMEEYFQYSSQTREEAALYLFDRDFISKGDLGSDFKVPDYFNSDVAEHGTDLFHVFGKERRPDYRWLIVGPARSGSIFHIDPNQTNAWNVCVKGRKKWIFYPPHVCPPGVVSSPDGADVTVPLSTGEWLLSFWQAHLEAKKNVDIKSRPFECIVEEGEMIFVPHGYWHMVINLDDCIAITQNYVSTSNLSDCLRFLREKPDQISGVRDRVDEAVQPEHIYQLFIESLQKTLSKTALDKAISDSFLIKSGVMKRGNNVSSAFTGSEKNLNRKKRKKNDIEEKDNRESVISSINEPRLNDGFSFEFLFETPESLELP